MNHYDHPYMARSRACASAAGRPCAPGSPEYKLGRHLMRTAQKLHDIAYYAC